MSQTYSRVTQKYCQLGHADVNLQCPQRPELLSWCSDKPQTHKASGMLVFKGLISYHFLLLLPLSEIKHENYGNRSILPVMIKLLHKTKDLCELELS